MDGWLRNLAGLAEGDGEGSNMALCKYLLHQEGSGRLRRWGKCSRKKPGTRGKLLISDLSLQSWDTDLWPMQWHVKLLPPQGFKKTSSKELA